MSTDMGISRHLCPQKIAFGIGSRELKCLHRYSTKDIAISDEPLGVIIKVNAQGALF
jgi:hypothetical protein